MPNRILALEDEVCGAHLLRRLLRATWPEVEITLATTADEYDQALKAGGYDVIVSDNRLPGFSGMEALSMAVAKAPDTPFVFFSGTLDEEQAIESLKFGASDYVLKDQAGKLVPAIRRALDLAEERQARERAERRLKEAETRFRTLVEKSLVGIYVIQNERFLYVNPRFAEIFEFSPEEITELPSILELVSEADRPLVADQLRERMVGQAESVHYTFRGLTKHGKRIEVEVIGNRTDIEGVPAVIGTLLDITEKKRLERHALQAQRLETVGMLTSGIAHDLNNILSPIMLSAELLESRQTESGRREMVGLIYEAAQRGMRLVKQVLSFSRGMAEEDLQLVEVGALVEDVEKLIRQTFPKQIRFSREIGSGIGSLRANPTHLHQVLLNLCVNARDSMPEGGDLKVKAESVGPDDLPLNVVLEGDRFVRLQVRDTGQGISPERLKKVFTPFYTTKKAGQGTGLGLSTVKSIVEKYKGYIGVRSQLGKGTVFEIYLPSEEKSAISGKPASHVDVPEGEGESILVVDNEEAVLKLIKTALENRGYRVTTASNGVEAIAIFAKRASEIDLVTTDLDMPCIDGYHLCAAILAIKPDVPVIVLSGSSYHEDKFKTKPKRLRHLRKPFSLSALLQEIHAAVNMV